MAKKKSKDITKYIAQRRSYLIGVGLGISLIVITSIIGLYVVNLILESEDDSGIVEFEKLPVPEIEEEAYVNFRDDFITRQTRNIKNFDGSKDPFSTN